MVTTFTWTWLDPADVRHWLRLNDAGDGDDAAEVEEVCVATEIYVQRCRPDGYTAGDDSTPDPAVYTPDAQIYRGAVMYAARWLRRRNSPSGIESFADVGVMFVSKYDPQINEALRTGDQALPGFG